MKISQSLIRILTTFRLFIIPLILLILIIGLIIYFKKSKSTTKKKVIIVLVIVLLVIAVFSGIYVFISTQEIWIEFFEPDIPDGYFVTLYGWENNMYSLDYDYSRFYLYLYLEDGYIKGVAVHLMENIGSSGGILERYGYQETIKFKTLDKLVSYIENDYKYQIYMIGEIYTEQIDNEVIVKYIKENGTETEKYIKDGYLGTGKYTLKYTDFMGLLEKIYENMI